jgi:parallel beta-helix repeat protein
LTSVRAKETLAKSIPQSNNKKQYGINAICGADAATSLTIPADAIVVKPGESVQEALNLASKSMKWVMLKTGVHTFKETLRIPSNVTLIGEGISTRLFLDPASGLRDVVVNATDDMHDVTIRDMVIEVSDRLEVPSDPNSHRSRGGGYNRGGILFHAMKEGQMKNINLLNLTVRNATFNGVFISGADQVSVIGCDFDENGGNAIPGQKLQHNLLLTHCRNILVKDSRMTTSPFGSGISLDQCQNATISNNEIARNGYYGMLISESKNISATGNLVEANDRSGIMLEYLFSGNNQLKIHDNLIQYNADWGIESYVTKDLQLLGNELHGNGNNPSQQNISSVKKIIMQ